MPVYSQCPPQVKWKAYWKGVAWVEPAITSKAFLPCPIPHQRKYVLKASIPSNFIELLKLIPFDSVW